MTHKQQVLYKCAGCGAARVGVPSKLPLYWEVSLLPVIEYFCSIWCMRAHLLSREQRFCTRTITKTRY